jgi:hypothetical protein
MVLAIMKCFELTAGLVSIIIPVFNRPVQLRLSVASALAQTYRPLEIIIVNDGSTDGVTGDVALELAHAYPLLVQVTEQANAGPGAARERGLATARGEFIQYLDSDDILLPGKLQTQVAALKATPDADVAYGITHFRDADGKRDVDPIKGTGEQVSSMFPKFLNSRWWSTETPLYRASVCRAAGPWTNLRLEEDWEYDCRIAALGGKLVWCPVPVSEHRDHGGSRLSRGTSRDPARLRDRARAQELIYQHALKYGLSPANPEMQEFSRSLFLLSRQCGAAGLAAESRKLFTLARSAAGVTRGQGTEFKVYALALGLLGTRLTGELCIQFDRLRLRLTSP